jgi:hypothetical protein
LTKGKPIKVVLIKENDGTWVPLMLTDTTMDLKDVRGWGKQELRLLESNEAATVMNMLANEFNNALNLQNLGLFQTLRVAVRKLASVLR